MGEIDIVAADEAAAFVAHSKLAPAHVRHRHGRAPAPACAPRPRSGRGRLCRPPRMRSNSNCMPRQMPSTGWVSARSVSRKPSASICPSRSPPRRRRAARPAPPHAIARGSPVMIGREPEPLEGDARPSRYCRSRDRRWRASQHALRAGHHVRLALARDRLAQRTAERLEAGLGLVMVVLAGDADMDRRARGYRRTNGRCDGSSRSDRRRYGWPRNCPRTGCRAGPKGRSEHAPRLSSIGSEKPKRPMPRRSASACESAVPNAMAQSSRL